MPARVDDSQWMVQSLNAVKFGFGGQFEMEKGKCKITMRRNRFHIQDRGDFHPDKYKLTDVPGALLNFSGRFSPLAPLGGGAQYQDFPILIQWGVPFVKFEFDRKSKKWQAVKNSKWPYDK